MSLEQRLKTFETEIITKGIVSKPFIHFNQYFYRLILSRRAIELILGILLLFGGQQFLIQNGFFSPVWPASGVALSAIFLRGRFLALAVFLGSLSCFRYHHYGWGISIAQSGLFTLTFTSIYFFSLKWIGTVAPLSTQKTLWQFMILCAFFCAIHITLLQFTFIHLFQIPFMVDWLTCWLGELNGILCLVPLSLIFDPFTPRQYFARKASAWWMISLMIILLHLLFYFLPDSTAVLTPSLILSFFLLIILSLYAKYFGQIPTCITLLGISILYLAGGLDYPHLFQITSSEKDLHSLTGLFTLTCMIVLSIATNRQEKIQ